MWWSMIVFMKVPTRIQERVNRYAGEQLKALRGTMSRVDFGDSIGMKESLMHKYETGQTNISVATLATLARRLEVPLSVFILPDDDTVFAETEE